MEISFAHPQDIPKLIALAQTTWHATYSSIISKEQIEYMFDLFYSEHVITEQMANPNHRFWKVEEQGELLGYAHCYPEGDAFKLSKLYILPNQQGKGIGQFILQAITKWMQQHHYSRMILNVNRHNPAYHFYVKMGFQVIEEVDIPLAHFWLNDYVMQKIIVSQK